MHAPFSVLSLALILLAVRFIGFYYFVLLSALSTNSTCHLSFAPSRKFTQSFSIWIGVNRRQKKKKRLFLRLPNDTFSFCRIHEWNPICRHTESKYKCSLVRKYFCRLRGVRWLSIKNRDAKEKETNRQLTNEIFLYELNIIVVTLLPYYYSYTMCSFGWLSYMPLLCI